MQAYAAALHMFAETASASANARPFIDKALASPLEATPREQGLIRAVQAWVEGDALRSVKLVGWLCAPLLPVCIAFALQPTAWLDRSDFARVALFPLTSLGCVGLLALGPAWQPPCW